MPGQDRREFLKLGCLTGLGAVALGAGVSARDSSGGPAALTLDVWRVRPGGEIPVVLRSPRPLEVHLVALDDDGEPADHWGPVPLQEVASGVFQGSMAAPDAAGSQYRMVAVAQTEKLLVSNSVLVICAPFHVGA
jgi:hypothetical protein